MAVDEFHRPREFAARHVVRQLNLPTEAFPVDVQLVFQVRQTPPPGSPPVDPMTPTVQSPLARYHFEKLSEVRP
jgi:hypothetical protein